MVGRIVSDDGEPLCDMGERRLLPGDTLTLNGVMVRNEVLIEGKHYGWIEGRAEFEWVAEPDKAIWSVSGSGHRLVIDESKVLGGNMHIGLIDEDHPERMPISIPIPRNKWMELLRSRAKDL